MLLNMYVYALINVMFSVNVVLGTLENTFVKHQTDDLACDNSSALTDFGNVRSAIACSIKCNTRGGCRGFYFNKVDGACWGSNQTECQTVPGTVFYSKVGQQTNATTNPGCTDGGTCTSPTDCGVPPAKTNAIVLPGNTTEGSVRSYSCDTGFVPDSTPTTITCEASGNWTVSVFSCVVDCGAPSAKANAAVLPGNTTEGSVRNYSCDPGFAPNSTPTTITCEASGNWTVPVFSCVVDCGVPSAKANAAVLPGNTTEGSVRSYSCDTGFALDSTPTPITCEASGNWTVPVFSCVVDCGVPSAKANAAVLPGNTTEGSVRSYSCDTGFAPNSTPTTITCEASGNWTVPVFSCIVDCGVPSAKANSAVLPGNTTEGSVRSYSCDTGFAPDSTPTTITCEGSGNWTVPVFSCVEDCGVPPVKANAAVLPGNTTEGSVRSYLCDTGFAPNSTPTTITCEASGNWTIPVFSCVVDCGVPSAKANAAVLPGNTTEGSVRSYSCDTGFAPNSTPTTVTCLVSGTWTVAAFSCIVDCGTPSAIANATVLPGNTTEGSVRSYSCDTGFAPNSTPTTITCEVSGTWTVAAFSCIVLECPSGWYRITNSCYKVSDTLSIVLSDAVTFCQTTYPAYNTYMLQLESATEDVAVVTNILQNYSTTFCLGLHDPLQNGVWKWMSTNEPPTYSNWAATQPDGQWNAIVRPSDSYQFRDLGPTLTCRPLCEISLM